MARKNIRIFHYNNHFGRIKGDKYEKFAYPVEKLDYHFYSLFDAKSGDLFYAYLAKVGYKGLNDEDENIFFVDFGGNKYDIPYTEILKVW